MTAQPATPISGSAPSASRAGIRRADLVAGLINAVVSVPDGLASAALVGVNPVYGLYTSIAAAITGSLLVSAQLMQIATTSASALTAGQAIAPYPAAQREAALFLLVLLTGVFLILFGLLRLGRLVRFVSFSVMTGFLIGVAVVLILDQLAPLVGFTPRGRNEIAQFTDLLAHTSQFSWPTVLTGVLALGLAIGLARTRFKAAASLIALVVPTLVVGLLGWKVVQRVNDVSPIPHGIPSLILPDLALVTPDLLASAFALAVVIAVQGAGVSESVQNPDRSPVSPSRDLVAQGAANVAAGLFSGIPAGGSVGQTALNVSAGARSRWAGVLSGVWMLLFVLLVPGLVGQVPMAVLAALMIVAGVSAIDVREARSIWQTGWPSRLAGGATLMATLFLPIQVAVGSGVVLSALLHLYASSTDVSLTRLTERPDGQIEVGPPPGAAALGGGHSPRGPRPSLLRRSLDPGAIIALARREPVPGGDLAAAGPHHLRSHPHRRARGLCRAAGRGRRPPVPDRPGRGRARADRPHGQAPPHRSGPCLRGDPHPRRVHASGLGRCPCLAGGTERWRGIVSGRRCPRHKSSQGVARAPGSGQT